MRSATVWCIATAILAGAAGMAPTQGQERLLRIGVQREIPRHLDPLDNQGRFQANIENVFEPLVYPHRDTWQIRGVLAEKWSVSPDGTRWTFTLRKGVTFHDGTPLTAKAVKLSHDYMMKIGRAQAVPLLREVVRDVRAVDDQTVEFIVEPREMPLLHRLTGLLIVSAKALDEHGSDPNWFANNAVGTGPYVVEEFRARDRMVLRRNEKWWGNPKPYFTRVVFLEIRESSAQALMTEKGELDLAYNLPPETLLKLEKDPKLRVIRKKGDRAVYIRMNNLHGPLAKKSLRQALAYAMDYAALLKAREFEISAPEGPVPAQYMGGWVPPDLVRRQDLARAKELLAQAGYKPGELTLDLYIHQAASVQITMAEIFQDSAKKIGANVKVTQIEIPTMLQRLRRYYTERDPRFAVDMFPLIRGPYVPHPYAYFSSYVKANFNNYMHYYNRRAEELFAVGFREAKEEEALKPWRRAVDMIVADQPDLWAYTEKRIIVMRRNLDGYYEHPIWFPETHVWSLRFK
ncbi:MAG: ABC transporter substrate-binding protein [Armatimonadetes bacterium]|nr:ABC transporter substrate-binding protein [Armatimonadota bacterium]